MVWGGGKGKNKLFVLMCLREEDDACLGWLEVHQEQ